MSGIAKKVKASSGTSTITSRVDWNAGTNNNTDTISSPGSLRIDNAASRTQYDLSAGIITSNPSLGNESSVIDGNYGSFWGPVPDIPIGGPPTGMNDWTINAGSQLLVSRVKIKYDGGESARLSSSNDSSSWTTVYDFGPPPTTYDVNLGSSENYQYWRVELWTACCGEIPYTMRLYELELLSAGTATHTTGSTQIDRGANFWEWETFTDSKTTPANTSVTNRYRTSTNGTDRTAWIGAIGSVTSRTGDDSDNPTKYRYLQIETTLSNTDGTSTPTIDSYSIGYHTNQKPNAPTAMTAVIN